MFSFQDPGACIYERITLFPEHIGYITTSNTTFSLTRITVPTIEKLINNIQYRHSLLIETGVLQFRSPSCKLS